VYDTTNRWNLFSPFYSNSGIAATISILALFFTAYLIIFFFFYTLVYSKNISVCFNSVFYKNFSYWLYTQDQMTLFNFSFLNVAVLICLFLLLYVKWNNAIDLSRTFELSFTFLIFFVFFVCSTYFLKYSLTPVLYPALDFFYSVLLFPVDIFIAYHPAFFRNVIGFVRCPGNLFSLLTNVIGFVRCPGNLFSLLTILIFFVIFEEFIKEKLSVLTRGFLRRPLYLSHPVQSGCKYLYYAIISSKDILIFLRELIKGLIFWGYRIIRYRLTVQSARLLYEDWLDFFWRIIYTNLLLYNNLLRLLKKDYLDLLFILSKVPYKIYYLLLIEYFCLTYRSIVKFLNDVFYLFKRNVTDFNYYYNSGDLGSDYDIFIFKLKWFPRHLLYRWRFFRIRVKISLVLTYRRFKRFTIYLWYRWRFFCTRVKINLVLIYRRLKKYIW
jgi:hypothetical protein